MAGQCNQTARPGLAIIGQTFVFVLELDTIRRHLPLLRSTCSESLMKATLPVALLCLCLSAPAFGDAPVWRGYGGNAQHAAQAPAQAKGVKKILWSTPVDLHPVGDPLYIHYGSPMITASNTVLVPVKTTTTGSFEMIAYNGKTGKKLWSSSTDYVFAPHDWTPSFPAHITAQNRPLYYAGEGGTVYYRDSPDMKKGAGGQIAFFGNSNYQANKSAYNSNVMVNGPITADEAGNIYFPLRGDGVDAP